MSQIRKTKTKFPKVEHKTKPTCTKRKVPARLPSGSHKAPCRFLNVPARFAAGSCKFLLKAVAFPLRLVFECSMSRFSCHRQTPHLLQWFHFMAGKTLTANNPKVRTLIRCSIS